MQTRTEVVKLPAQRIVQEIPASEETITIYVANDGTEFRSKDECLVHDGISHIPTAKIEVFHPTEERYGTLFRLESRNDFDALAAYYYRRMYCEKFDPASYVGRGWYILFIYDGADSRDSYEIYTVEALGNRLQELKDDCDNYLLTVLQIIGAMKE